MNALEGTKGKYKSMFCTMWENKKCRNRRKTAIIGERLVNPVTDIEQSVEQWGWGGRMWNWRRKDIIHIRDWTFHKAAGAEQITLQVVTWLRRQSQIFIKKYSKSFLEFIWLVLLLQDLGLLPYWIKWEQKLLSISRKLPGRRKRSNKWRWQINGSRW